MVILNDESAIYRKPFSVVVLIDWDEQMGVFVARVNDEVNDEFIDAWGLSVGDLMNNVVAWADIEGIDFGFDDSVEEIRQAMAQISSSQTQMKIYTSF